jgi:DNA polymerase-1
MLKEKGWNDVSLILQVHDELVYEVPEKLAVDAAREIRHVMESVAPKEELSEVPILAEAAIGKDWGAMEKIKRT